MRTAVLGICIMAVCGCGVEVLTTTAIQSELQAEQMSSLSGQIERASDTTARINLQKALDTFYAEKGYYPLTLGELVPDYIASIPTQPDGSPYPYDAVNGKITDGAGAASAAPAVEDTRPDEEKAFEIRMALDQYQRDTGHFPSSLSDLSPRYLSNVPVGASGAPFGYDARSGALYPPGATAASYTAQQAPAQTATPAPAQQRVPGQPTPPQRRSMPRARGGVGGAGPMGEMMTGIGVQNELNRMGNSGVNTAGSYGKGKIGQTQQQHSQQQMDALNQMGF